MSGLLVFIFALGLIVACSVPYVIAISRFAKSDILVSEKYCGHTVTVLPYLVTPFCTISVLGMFGISASTGLLLALSAVLGENLHSVCKRWVTKSDTTRWKTDGFFGPLSGGFALWLWSQPAVSSVDAIAILFFSYELLVIRGKVRFGAEFRNTRE